MNTTQPKHSVSVAGVIVDDQDRALLVRRQDNRQWEPPGGVLELNESIDDGLKREIYEETGFTVEPIALTGVYKNIMRGIVALVFRCRPIAGELRLNAEVSEFRWATCDDISILADEAFAIRILDALDNPRYPAIRLHDGVHLVLGG